MKRDLSAYKEKGKRGILERDKSGKRERGRGNRVTIGEEFVGMRAWREVDEEGQRGNCRQTETKSTKKVRVASLKGI